MCTIDAHARTSIAIAWAPKEDATQLALALTIGLALAASQAGMLAARPRSPAARTLMHVGTPLLV